MMDNSDFEESDDDLGCMLKQALDVSMPTDFDPNSVPQTGEEYLQHVIYERSKKCKSWVTAKGDFTKFTKNQNIHIQKDVGVQKALDKFYPTKEWQDNAIQDFTQFRNFLTNTIRKEPTKFFDENFLTNVDENPPTFSELTSICQASKVQMLHKIGKHIITNFDQSRGLSENMGAWIYGILALLEKPLTPDCCFKLREFAKKCAQIRATFSSEIDESLATPLNLYICIVARYFNQLDLIN